MIKNKLSIHGGEKLRKTPMPNRVAFGELEVKHLNEAIQYYRDKDIDPPYSGIYEEKFCRIFQLIWVVVFQTQ